MADIISIIIPSPEVVIDGRGDPVLKICRTLGQYTLRSSLDIRRQNTIIMWFVKLGKENKDQVSAKLECHLTELTMTRAHLLVELKGTSNTFGEFFWCSS